MQTGFFGRLFILVKNQSWNWTLESVSFTRININIQHIALPVKNWKQKAKLDDPILKVQCQVQSVCLSFTNRSILILNTIMARHIWRATRKYCIFKQRRYWLDQKNFSFIKFFPRTVNICVLLSCFQWSSACTGHDNSLKGLKPNMDEWFQSFALNKRFVKTQRKK